MATILLVTVLKVSIARSSGSLKKKAPLGPKKRAPLGPKKKAPLGPQDLMSPQGQLGPHVHQIKQYLQFRMEVIHHDFLPN